MPSTLASLAANRAPARQRRPLSAVPRALFWDANNSSSLLAAQAFLRHGWQIDWLGSADSPWRHSGVWTTRTIVSGLKDPGLERIFNTHPLDALLLHGDNQVRWILSNGSRLPARAQAHLPSAESLEIGLSKQRSMHLASTLGIPVLDTVLCRSRDEVPAAAARVGAGRRIVLKGEGGAAGDTLVGLAAGAVPTLAQWRGVAAHAPIVMLQKRITGPRYLVTVAYERGVERAACVHEKSIAYPSDFGPCAFGVTRRLDTLHDYAARLFGALQWHGIADVEFRQDAEDGHWYFMEINPRVCATLGIQERAGLDLVGAWVAVCEGRGADDAPGRDYRDGVTYAWATRALARWMRAPWTVRPWQIRCLLSANSDLHLMEPALQANALRTALWMARHA